MAMDASLSQNDGPPWGRHHYRRMQNVKVSFILSCWDIRASVYRTLLLCRFAGQRKARFGRAAVRQLLRKVCSERRPMFEPVPGTSARKPHVIYFRVPVDQKISVRSVFILAHARLDDWRVCQGREALCHVRAHALDGFGRHHACLRVRINALAVTIKSDLDAA